MLTTVQMVQRVAGQEYRQIFLSRNHMFANSNQTATSIKDTEEFAARCGQVLGMVKNSASKSKIKLAVAEGQVLGELLNNGDRQPTLFSQRTNGTCTNKIAAVWFEGGHGKSFSRERVARNTSARSYIKRLPPRCTKQLSDVFPLVAFPIASGSIDQGIVVIGAQDEILAIGLRAQPLYRALPCRKVLGHVSSLSDGVSSRIG